MFNNIIKKMFPRLNTLLKILDAVENVVVTDNDSLYIKFKQNVAVEANGNIITYTKNGYSISKSKLTFINPTVDPNFFILKNSINFIELDLLCNTIYAKKLYDSKEKRYDRTTDKKQGVI